MVRRSVVFELTDSEIRALVFSWTRSRGLSKRADAVKFDRIPIPTGTIEQGNVRHEDTLLSILMTYGKQLHFECREAFILISLQQGFIRSYKLPWLPKRDRQSALSLLVAEEVPISGADLLYDSMVISQEKREQMQIILGATRQSLLERYIELFGKAGFYIAGIEFSLFVLGRALGFKFNEDVLFLQGESKNFQTVLFRGWVPESIRSFSLPEISTSLSQSPESQEKAWYEEREREIRRFLLYYQNQQPDWKPQRLLWNGDSVVGRLALELKTSGCMSTIEQVAIERDSVAWQSILEENKGSSEAAIGYALQILARSPRLNLWRQPLTVLNKRRRFLGLAYASMVLFLVVVVIGFSLQHRSLALRQEVQQLSFQGAEAAGKIRRLSNLETAWNKAGNQPETISTGLEKIQAISGLKLTIEKITYRQGILLLNGSASDAESVESLIAALREMDWKEPALTGYQLGPSNIVRFSLSAKR